MGTARFAHTATLLPNGKVLITGGFASAQVNQQAKSLASSEVYDPATGTFSSGGDMTVARGGHTATLLQDGTLLVAGGFATIGPSTMVLSSCRALRSVNQRCSYLDKRDELGEGRANGDIVG